MTKTCTKCKETKDVSEFYPCIRYKGGLRSYCKSCSLADSKKWCRENPERKKEIFDKWVKNNKRAARELWRKASKKYLENPENRKKHACRLLVRSAVKNGLIIKTNCEVCNNPNTEAHHKDYSKPLDVNWLCDSCHGKLKRRP